MKNKKLTRTYVVIYGAKGFLGTKINCFANSKDEAISKIEKYIKDNNIFKGSYYCVCISEDLFLLD